MLAMLSQQIFVALVCLCLTSQQVAAVVNNGQSKKAEESNKSSVESTEKENSSTNKIVDSVAESTEDKSNRREAPLSLGDTYGAPLTAVSDTYLPSEQNSLNLNLPVPVYGVPDAPSNNIAYPAPPPDIPPPVSLAIPSSPSHIYGPPSVSTSYGLPLAKPTNTYIPSLSNNYGPPNIKYDIPSAYPSKLFTPARPKPAYGPPRFQYGPPGKPLYSSGKFHKNFPSKHFGSYRPPKPVSAYGAPISLKDNYSPAKLNLNLNSFNYLNNANSLSHSSHSSHQVSNLYSGAQFLETYGLPSAGGHSISTQYALPDSGNLHLSNQYGVPSIPASANLHLSGQYGAPNLPVSGNLHLSNQYGAPHPGVVGPPASHYGPPQPSPNPKPPHPGAPAPPTPPDIKYDGWQPIPGLVSKVPPTSYGAPPSDHVLIGDVGYNKDLSPPPLANDHGLGLGNSYSAPLHSEASGGHQQLSDSYGAPLNTVTGSGGVIASSGEEVHGHHAQADNVASLGLSVVGLDQSSGVQAIKSVGYEIFPNGNSGYKVSDSYGAPPLNSYSSNGPYAAAHSYNNHGSSSFNNFQSSQSSFNSHKSHGYKGLSLSSSGIGLIPPSGVYGLPSSGQYGTPLFGNGHQGPLNALKINQPKRPVIHREPVPHGLFQSIAKQSALKESRGHSSHISSGPVYIPPPISDLPRKIPPAEPSNLYSLPHEHSAVSFQNFAQGSSSAGLLNHDLYIDGATSSALTSYNAPLGIVDGSYSLPTSGNGASVGLDFTHPAVTIDLTGNHGQHSNQINLPHDCSLNKQQPIPSLAYGVPSVDSYTSSLSSLTTNIGGNHVSQSNAAIPHATYGVPDLGVQQINLQATSKEHGVQDLSYSPSVKSEAKVNVIQTEPLVKVSGKSATATKSFSKNSQNLIQGESHGKSYGKSVAESFGPNSELIESQSLDLNNIPLQGSLGSYTLQIQSTDPQGGQSQVPHSQVLNEGLLQSILAAIEQPQQNNGNGPQVIQLQQSQPVAHLEQQQHGLQQVAYVTSETQNSAQSHNNAEDAELQHSSPNESIVDPPKNDEDKDSIKNETKTLQLIEDNGIALYFSNKNEKSDKDVKDIDRTKEVKAGDIIHNSH